MVYRRRRRGFGRGGSSSTNGSRGQRAIIQRPQARQGIHLTAIARYSVGPKTSPYVDVKMAPIEATSPAKVQVGLVTFVQFSAASLVATSPITTDNKFPMREVYFKSVKIQFVPTMAVSNRSGVIVMAVIPEAIDEASKKDWLTAPTFDDVAALPGAITKSATGAITSRFRPRVRDLQMMGWHLVDSIPLFTVALAYRTLAYQASPGATINGEKFMSELFVEAKLQARENSAKGLTVTHSVTSWPTVTVYETSREDKDLVPEAQGTSLDVESEILGLNLIDREADSAMN